jgi:hypothetical protein
MCRAVLLDAPLSFGDAIMPGGVAEAPAAPVAPSLPGVPDKPVAFPPDEFPPLPACCANDDTPTNASAADIADAKSARRAMRISIDHLLEKKITAREAWRAAGSAALGFHRLATDMPSGRIIDAACRAASALR